MARLNTERGRLSIDVLPEEHRQIKARAALRGQTIREYVLESVRERLRDEKQGKIQNRTSRSSKKGLE